MDTTVWTDIVQAATNVARENNQDIADVSLDAIARRAGISRATLYRRIGNRDRLDEAIRAAGFDPGGRGDVRERAINATAELISVEGLSAYNLEAVATRANCSVQALHSQVGGRDALLTATFERFSPLPRVEEALADRPASLEEGVRRIYTIAFDALSARPLLVAAILSDALGQFRTDPWRQSIKQGGRRAGSLLMPSSMAGAGRWVDVSRRGTNTSITSAGRPPCMVAHCATLQQAPSWR